MSWISLQLRQKHSLYDLNKTQQSTSMWRYQSQWEKKAGCLGPDSHFPHHILSISKTFTPYTYSYKVTTNRQYLCILITHLPDGKLLRIPRKGPLEQCSTVKMTQHIWAGAIWKGFTGIELKDLSLKEHIILKVVAKEGLFASLKRGYFIPLMTLIIK